MKLLLLAGTGEARQVARALGREPGVSVIASLAGATMAPAPLGVPTRVGGFGGRRPFRDWLAAEGTHAVLDATHPFAARMSRRAAEVSAELGLPHLRLLRPPWTAGPGDRWSEIDAEEETAGLVPEGATVFLATGPKTLGRFGGLEGRRLICRRIDPPEGPFPFPGGRWQVGRPPFTLAAERSLFRGLGVDWLVAKNSGGGAGRPKLDAARELGIPVAMIRRPDAPAGARVETVAAALAWVRGLARG